MKVKNVYQKKVATIYPEQTFAEAIEKTLTEKTNSLVVVDKENKVLGIMTCYEFIRAMVPFYLDHSANLSTFMADGTFAKFCIEAKDKKVADIMNSEVVTVKLDTRLTQIATDVMESSNMRIPVVDDNNTLIGIITRTQIRQAIGQVLKEQLIK